MTKKVEKKQNMIQKNSEPALVIITIADLHGQLEPTYAWSADSTLQERGGIARIAAHVNAIRKLYPEKVLFFGSGDYLIEDFNRGTYFKAFGGAAMAYFLNALNINVSTIGNHDFDFGMQDADSTLRACSFPIVATNLKQSDLTCNMLKKLIIDKNGYKIGVLGVMLPLPANIYSFMGEVDKAGNPPLQFETDLYSCMQNAVNDLKYIDNVDYVIVLSHIGIDDDQKLAQHVNGIDLICGGHTHAVTKKGCELVVQKFDHHQTIISHPGDKGRTLGLIKLWPKENNHVAFECDVIEVDSSLPPDQHIEEKLQFYKKQLPESPVVVTTTLPIDTTKQAMRKQENGFANFVTDAIRDFFGADIVLINARSISGEDILPPGPVTERDIDKLFSFDNDYLIRLKASGNEIRQALELGAADIKGKSLNLVHPSGLQYTIDPSKPALIPNKNEQGMIIGIKKAGSMIVNIDALQKNNKYAPLDDDLEYDIIINSMMIDEAFYVAQFYMFKAIQDQQNIELNMKDVLIKYFKTHPIISPKIDDRLRIKKNQR